MKKIFLPDSEATEALGRQIAANLRIGDIVNITGVLGAGKTTLVRGILAGLGGDPTQVHSPTFSLVHEYESPVALVNHCDFYRLPPESGLEEFGGIEFFSDEKIFLVEWPERVRLPDLPTLRPLFHVHLRDDASGRIADLPSIWKIVD